MNPISLQDCGASLNPAAILTARDPALTTYRFSVRGITAEQLHLYFLSSVVAPFICTDQLSLIQIADSSVEVFMAIRAPAWRDQSRVDRFLAPFLEETARFS